MQSSHVPRSLRSALIISLALCLRAPSLQGQQHQPKTAPQTSHGMHLPEFAVASIRPVPLGSNVIWGFRSFPGGRVEIGGTTVKLLMYYAFDVQQFQIAGGPNWISSDCFAVKAIPPDTSKSRFAPQTGEVSRPTEEQRQMLQKLLYDRFGLRVHEEIQQRPVYILTKGKHKLGLNEPQNTEREPAFSVLMRAGVVSGEMRGSNVSMAEVAKDLSTDLGVSVLDQTGLTGSYDFHVEPFDPENRDLSVGVIGAVRRLGLELNKSVGPVRILVVDNVTKPTAN